MPVTTASAMLLEPALQLARHFPQQAELEPTRELLESAGLTQEEFTKPGARFPAQHFSRVLETLTRLSDNPLVWLNLGEATQPRTLGSIGFLMTTSATLEQAYQSLIDYLPLMYEGAVLELESGLEGTVLTLELNDNDPRTIEFLFACLCNWPRWLIGHQVPIAKVRMTRQAPENTQAYQQFFAAEMEFGAPRNQLLLNSDYLSRPCLDANPEMHRLHQEFADALLSKSTQQGALIAQTRNLIRQQLSQAGGSVRREQVAGQLGLSLRTLQRKLGQLGTSFQDIYDQTRREYCLQLIQQGQHSFGEIAFQLGFSNQSAFQKAFKRWMGVPPSEYRQQVQPLQPERISPTAAVPQNYSWLEQDNPAQSLQQKLSELSLFGRELLECACVMGPQFDLNQLAAITDNPLPRLAINLWPAQRAGLIAPTDDDQDQTRFRFARRAIHQLLYRLIPEREQQRWHRRCATRLQAQLPAADQQSLEQLATLLQHLHQLPTQQLADPDSVITLNRRAAALARQQQQYLQASHYLLHAMALSSTADSFFALPLECAELQLLAGCPDDAQRTLSALTGPVIASQPLNLQGQYALLQARLHIHQGNIETALQTLLAELDRQQQSLPQQPTEQLNLLLQQLGYISEQFNAQTLTSMAGKHFDRHYHQLQLLEQVSLLARQLSQPLLAACAIGRMTEISLRYGRSPLTPFAYISYAWVAGWFCADYSMAQTFAAQGMRLVNRFGGLGKPGSELHNERHNEPAVVTDQANSAALVHSAQVTHWFTPLAQNHDMLEQITRTTAEHGFWQQYSECQLLSAQLNLLSETPLSDQSHHLQQQYQQLQTYQLETPARQLQDSIIQLVQDLQQGWQPQRQIEYRNGWQTGCTIVSALLLDQQHCWPTLLAWESQLEREQPGYFWVSEALFCTALMRLITAQQQGGISPRRQREVEQTISRFELWSRQCPTNFEAQRWLLEAEYCQVQDQNPARCYEQALSAAQEQGFSFHPALVQERYGRYLQQQGQDSLAQFCLGQALAFYQHWGANEKANQMKLLANAGKIPQSTETGSHSL